MGCNEQSGTDYVFCRKASPIIFKEIIMSAIVDTLVQQDKPAFLDVLFGLVSPSDPAVGQTWIVECEQRAAAIDRGEMPLVSANEVMQKYRTH